MGLPFLCGLGLLFVSLAEIRPVLFGIGFAFSVLGGALYGWRQPEFWEGTPGDSPAKVSGSLVAGLSIGVFGLFVALDLPYYVAILLIFKLCRHFRRVTYLRGYPLEAFRESKPWWLEACAQAWLNLKCDNLSSPPSTLDDWLKRADFQDSQG